MTTKNKKGFTIIEVVLVLAIAGLIFLMVFIALPALQRSQRNTQREDDMSRVLTAITQFQTNNNGKTPFNASMAAGKLDTFVTRYLDSECTGGTATANMTKKYTSCGAQFSDPDGQPYNIEYRGAATAANADISGALKAGGTGGPVFDHTIHAYSYATCGDEGYVKKGSGARQVVIFFVL